MYREEKQMKGQKGTRSRNVFKRLPAPLSKDPSFEMANQTASPPPRREGPFQSRGWALKIKYSVPFVLPPRRPAGILVDRGLELPIWRVKFPESWFFDVVYT